MSKTLIDHSLINDEDLSDSERGLLFRIIAFPPHTELTIQLLITKRNGRDSVAKGMQRLIKLGYIRREQRRGDGGNFIGWDYEILKTKKYR